MLKKIIDSIKGDNLKGQLVRRSIGVGSLKLFSIPITLVASILLARFLGPEKYGQYSFVMAVITVLALPIKAGIQQLITREVASYHHSEDWGYFKGLLRRSNQWSLTFSIFVIIIVATFSIFHAKIESSDRWTLLLVAIFILPFMGLSAIRSGALRGLGNVVNAQLPDQIIRPGLHLVNVSIIILIGVLNPISALFSQVIAVSIAFMVSAYLLKKKTPLNPAHVRPKYESRKWLLAWVPFTLLMAANMFNNQLGILFLGWLGDDAEVGALQVADKAARFVSFSLIAVNMVISPYITRYFKESNFKRLQKLSRQSARAAFGFALPIALPMIFYGTPIINFVFGKDYVNLTVIPLAILAGANLISVIFGSVGMFLTMSGFEKDTLFGQIIALIINGLLAFILIPVMGTIGAALAAAAGMLTWNIILAFKFKQRLNLSPSVF